MKVRRRPLILEAVHWEGQELDGVIPFTDPDNNVLYGIIKTLEGPFVIRPGYWVVYGVEGEKWAVEPSIFWQTYEKVEQDGN